MGDPLGIKGQEMATRGAKSIQESIATVWLNVSSTVDVVSIHACQITVKTHSSSYVWGHFDISNLLDDGCSSIQVNRRGGCSVCDWVRRAAGEGTWWQIILAFTGLIFCTMIAIWLTEKKNQFLIYRPMVYLLLWC